MISSGRQEEKMGRKANRVIHFLDSLFSLPVLLAALVLLGVSVYSLIDQARLYRGAADSTLLDYKPALNEPIQEKEIISDKQVSWLTVYRTGIDYPVMQGQDNYEFLNKDPYGEFRLSGSLFLDFRNSGDFTDPYSMIYGHHMEHGAMFGSLDYFLDPAYFANHRQGQLYTREKVYRLEFFALLYAKGDDPLFFSPARTSTQEILRYLDQHALIRMGEQPGARLLALSTCAGETDMDRLILIGTLTE